MEDFEAIVSPFAMAARRKQEQEKLNHLELTDNEKSDLIRFANSSEYQTFLKLMEGEIIKQETIHFQNWKDREQFQDTGLIAVAQRLFFEHIQKTVQHHVGELQAEIERKRFEAEVSKMTPAELLENELM